MAASGEQTHRRAPTNDQPVTIVLDLVHPAGFGRRLGGEGANAGLDKAWGKDASPAHSFEPPQPSSCRGVARIAISEKPKTNSTAKLMTLMTAKGMFSQHRNNSPPLQSDTPTLEKTLEPAFWFNISCN
jgi:hypothetical protein